MKKFAVPLLLAFVSLASASVGYLQGVANGKKEGIDFIEECFAVLSQSSRTSDEPGLIIKRCIDAGSEIVGIWHIAKPKQEINP